VAHDKKLPMHEQIMQAPTSHKKAGENMMRYIIVLQQQPEQQQQQQQHQDDQSQAGQRN